jgi:hypothetical protein
VVIGVFALQFRIFDVIVTLIFGVIGYFMLRYGFPPAAAALAALLSYDFERSLRQGLNLTGNDIGAFVTRPLTAVILLFAIAVGVYGVISQRRMRNLDDRAAAILAAAEEEEALARQAATRPVGDDGRAAGATAGGPTAVVTDAEGSVPGSRTEDDVAPPPRAAEGEDGPAGPPATR